MGGDHGGFSKGDRGGSKACRSLQGKIRENSQLPQNTGGGRWHIFSGCPEGDVQKRGRGFPHFPAGGRSQDCPLCASFSAGYSSFSSGHPHTESFQEARLDSQGGFSCASSSGSPELHPRRSHTGAPSEHDKAGKDPLSPSESPLR